MMFPVFISCPKGLEGLLSEELKTLHIFSDRTSPQGVYSTLSLEDLYRVCLWSRLAGRVQVILFEDAVETPEDLYAACRAFAWENVFLPEKTFAITFHGSSSFFRNTLFGAQVVKDAVADYFKEKTGLRPHIDRENPDILLHAFLKNGRVTVSLDVVGYSLHQRGYRQDAGEAPLKEHLAAAMLMRAGWPKLMKEGYALQDLCCGSGTLVIEGLMMAANIAPGLLRQDKAFYHWQSHDESIWQKVRATAESAVIKPTVLADRKSVV